MPIKEGKEDKAMYVREDTGLIFGMSEVWLRSSCLVQTMLGYVYKVPEDYPVDLYESKNFWLVR